MDNQTLSLRLHVDQGALPLLGVLLRAIVLKHLSQHYSICTIVRDFLENVPVSKILLTDLDDHLEERLHHAIDNGCQAFVVDEPGIAPLLDLFVRVHDLSLQRAFDKSLILLVTEQNRAEVMDRIVTHEALREILNVLIIVYNEVDKVTGCYTVSIRHTNVRDAFRVDLHPLLIDRGTWEEVTFFPDHSKDFRGYLLRIGAINYVPFTRVISVDAGTGNAFNSETGERSIWLDGTELQLMVTFCERRNYEEDGWGDIYPNGTANGLLGGVYKRRTDICVSAIYMWLKLYNVATYTTPISRSGLTILVPKPHMQPFWRTPLLSFSWPLWAAVMVTFVVGSFAAWVAGRVRYRLLGVISSEPVPASEQLPFNEVLLMVVGFFVAQSMTIRNDLWSCVFLFASLLLAGFMVSNMYSGGLASVMTVPQYEKSIDTVKDFAASGMLWYGPTPYCLEEIVLATEPHLRQIQTTFKVCYLLEDTKRHVRTVDSGFIIEHAQHGNFAPSDFLDGETSMHYQMLLDDIYFQNCAGVVTKTNPLLKSLNDFILQVQQAGLSYHWGTMAAIRYLPTDVFRNIEQARMHRHGDGQTVTLQIDHFLGAFFILAYGLLCAAVAFVGELWGPDIGRRLKLFFRGRA